MSKTFPPLPKQPLRIFLIESDPAVVVRLQSRFATGLHASRFRLVGMDRELPDAFTLALIGQPVDAVLFDPDVFAGRSTEQIVLALWKIFDRRDGQRVDLIVHSDRWIELRPDFQEFGVIHGFVREYRNLELILAQLANERE